MVRRKALAPAGALALAAVLAAGGMALSRTGSAHALPASPTAPAGGASCPGTVSDLNSLPASARNACARPQADAAFAALKPGDNSDAAQGLRKLHTWLTNPNDAAKMGGGKEGEVLGLDTSGQGRVILAMGDPDTATNVVVTVPGVGMGLNDALDQITFNETMTYQEIAKGQPAGSVASIMWMGYDAPKSPSVFNLGALSTDAAKAGAQPLLDFLNGLRATHRGGKLHLTVTGHSYGSAVVGAAQKIAQIPADDIILIASPGVPEATAGDFHIGSHVWAATNQDDWIANVQDQTTGNGPLGATPTNADFNARVFEAEKGGHGAYWGRGRPSLSNMVKIILGQDNITICHAPNNQLIQVGLTGSPDCKAEPYATNPDPPYVPTPDTTNPYAGGL